MSIVLVSGATEFTLPSTLLIKTFHPEPGWTPKKAPFSTVNYVSKRAKAKELNIKGTVYFNSSSELILFLQNLNFFRENITAIKDTNNTAMNFTVRGMYFTALPSFNYRKLEVEITILI